jgi:acetyl-CoA C-acetyltransferase
LSQVTSVRVVRGIWPYQNPAAAIAQSIGAQAETGITPYGGNFVQSTVNACALDIQQGKHELIVLTGAECGNTQAKAAKAKVDLDWQAIPGTPDILIGEDVEMRHDAEKAIRLGRPIQVYPIFETALRHHLGLGVEEHLQRISELWAGFSAVAAKNPHAWIREAKSAQEIRTLSPVNRPVSYPYPKFMNSNSNVDQGAALILCSTSKARALGIPEDKWIYPWSGTDAHDHYFVSNRDNLYSSPAIRLAGNRALELSDVASADLDYVDVYSCFPVAVQVAARELGLDIAKPLTVTGGLTWAGGPLNNYVMHSIARMGELLRATPGTKGLITANGGYLTKHAFGVYSTEPPGKPFQHEDLQPQVDALTRREVAINHRGIATVEGYSVMYAGAEPAKAFVAAQLADGRRAWGVTEDSAVMQDMIENEYCGREVRLSDNTASF